MDILKELSPVKEKKIPVSVVLTIGGHTFEALALLDKISGFVKPSYFICDNNFLAKDKIRIPGPHCIIKKSFALTKGLRPKDYAKELYLFFRAFFTSLFGLLRFKSRAVISLGSGSSFPVLVAAKVLGKKIIFIESACRIKSRSFCGNIVYKYFSSLFLVQWEDLVSLYPKAVYAGRPF